ncbi:hypothetical protein GCM10010174_27560 [Kutzneria viridogrisea]|uniref:Lasso RiPP family leader peptide-containing protein n=2 Tax=Kutzneria TaxID=43356 RepID=W5W939_9PSEU|nr:lasso RiPP family leader peptide-containing protein [Kutzneria albida]AHH97260.1 hypothetical protein KALB_3896 [Kutzneria albida DSM 43870]MBA8930826.1 hypothetical protein [Kutzneria viridogrisea]
MEAQDLYEPPAVVEIGDYAELTMGGVGTVFDTWGLTPIP